LEDDCGVKISVLSPGFFLLFSLMTYAAPLQDIPFKTMDGRDASLKDHSGKVVLVAKVASKCGNRPPSAGLEGLYKKYGPQGLMVLGFPCNDFGGQEPGTNEEIQAFCASIPKTGRLRILIYA
jgi:glutathione peroxidase